MISIVSTPQTTSEDFGNGYFLSLTYVGYKFQLEMTDRDQQIISPSYISKIENFIFVKNKWN